MLVSTLCLSFDFASYGSALVSDWFSFSQFLVTPGEKITSCYVPADHWQDHLLFGFVKQSKSLLGF